jgi:hypothetical protein
VNDPPVSFIQQVGWAGALPFLEQQQLDVICEALQEKHLSRARQMSLATLGLSKGR